MTEQRYIVTEEYVNVERLFEVEDKSLGEVNIWLKAHECEERTCRLVPSGDPNDDTNPFRTCTSCGAYNIWWEYYDADGHRTRAKFCPECGTRVVEQ